MQLRFPTLTLQPWLRLKQLMQNLMCRLGLGIPKARLSFATPQSHLGLVTPKSCLVLVSKHRVSTPPLTSSCTNLFANNNLTCGTYWYHGVLLVYANPSTLIYELLFHFCRTIDQGFSHVTYLQFNKLTTLQHPICRCRQSGQVGRLQLTLYRWQTRSI